MTKVTRILAAIEQGDPHSAEQLLPLVYDELRRLAAQKLALEKPGQTLQATALVHEAYLRLVDGGHAQDWNRRGHFFAAAAEPMRRILVDNARRKRRPKHGGDQRRLPLDAVALPVDDLVDLDEALNAPARQEPLKAELVKLRYFAGLSVEESAACLGIAPVTAKRYWAVARAWFNKFGRRNLAALTTVALVAAALVVGTGVSIWQAVRATQARKETAVHRERINAGHSDRPGQGSGRAARSRPAIWSRPNLELLEDRTLLSGVSFSPAVNYAVGALPISVAVGDFNGDGKPDLAVGINDSATLSVMLNALVTTTAVSGPTSSSYSQSVTYTATVLNGVAPVTTGTVTFQDGNTPISAALPLSANGQATFSVASLNVGNHTITATYSGTPGGAGTTGLGPSVGNTNLTTDNPLPLSAAAINFSAIAGAPFTGAIATLMNPDPFGTAASYAATID